jgi:hypothetical protein
MKKLKKEKSCKPQASPRCAVVDSTRAGGWAHELQAASLTMNLGQCRMQTMNTITYKDKKLKLPYDLAAGETSTEMVTRQNPFSGQSIQLPEFAAVIYDKCVELNLKAERKDSATGQPPGISEHQDDWQKVRNGLDWFRQYFAEEYMVLLD